MQDLQEILNQIPIKHNLVSQFIFLGVFQGFFIGFVILARTSIKTVSIKLLGYFFIIHSLVLLDTYSCYTGLIKKCITLNDSTEPLILLWGPLIYLSFQGILMKKHFCFRDNWVHFLLPFLYFLSQIGYYIQPDSVKLNAYLSAYFPNANRAVEIKDLSFYYQVIKDEFRWLILTSFIYYLSLSVKMLLSSRGKTKKNGKKDKKISKYQFSLTTLGIFFCLIFIVTTIFLNFETDLGDHYIAIFQTFLVFIMSFMILSESRFFEKSWLANKYETLTISDDTITITTIKKYVEDNEYYLLEDSSLKKLAQALDTNSNLLSKTINSKAGMNFNDFINTYRVGLSKKRLIDQNYKHLTIEGIGNSVGFKSKSTFYNAFKKHTNISPSAFIQAFEDKAS